MLRDVFFPFSIVVFFSCNSSTVGQNISSRANVDSAKYDSLNLVERANYFYENKIYAKAKFSYDTLISIDSTKGEYYFKRGYCKSMIPDSKGAVIDYLLSIEHNYDKKYKAYLNIGVLHRGNAVFYSTSQNKSIAEYDTALYFFNECLKIAPNNVKAIKERDEVIGILKELK